jgi:flagellar biosynthesis component FlhA
LALWNTLEYIILHLSAVVRKNAAGFLGVKAVADLIRTKQRSAYEALCNAPGGLPRLTAVLGILLEEEVSISELAAICGRYLALASSAMPAHAIADELRVLEPVRPSLVYSRDSITIWELGKKLVKLIREGIIEHGDAVVLALEPEPTQEALSAVRTEVSNLPPTAGNPVVLVEDWRLRRPFRKLVELEFPHLRVLSRRELAGLADSYTSVGTIEID